MKRNSFCISLLAIGFGLAVIAGSALAATQAAPIHSGYAKVAGHPPTGIRDEMAPNHIIGMPAALPGFCVWHSSAFSHFSIPEHGVARYSTDRGFNSHQPVGGAANGIV